MRVTLHHDQHIDLVDDENGDITVMTADGPARRRRELIDNEGNTTELRFPSDYDPTPVALMHLVEMIKSRHSENVTGVSGEDERLVSKLAALLDAEILTEESEA